ncbi:hypothetical protein ONR57_22900 [Hoyosella sp. YIM 151337]|uniref:hypothetical protein n=1 Tax=Hoyosella sp. YIM 151337 TaxID=2992742 RepID=UPI002236205B|nr:hypothetical protein [Hoyosella sp. YIM 151337]MCW4356159.1 hypothetical protein [Hoyosella sp. YIM 151337]
MSTDKPKRRYRLTDDDTKQAAVDTVVAQIQRGTSFTAACRAVAEQIDVSEQAVRTWVNRSGRRPRAAWDEVIDLRARLEAALHLNRRLQQQPETRWLQ